MDRNTYRFVGVSRHPNGELAVRYTNDPKRDRVLAKNGHTEILFLDMEQPERVEECVDRLMTYVETEERVDLLQTVLEEAERVGYVFG